MSIYENLFTWQKNIVDSCIDKDAYGLWLDMGLGKTPISLALAEQHCCSKVIVVSINSKVLEDEYVKGSWLYWSHFSNIKYNYNIKKQSNFRVNENDFYLINYEQLFSRKKDRRKRNELSDNVKAFIESCTEDDTCCIIIDESHHMNDLQSRQTKAIVEIKRQLTRRTKHTYCYLLSGTPFTKGYIDLYSQLSFLGYPETKGHFIDEYCVRGNVPGLLGWQQPVVGYKNVPELFNVIHKYAITIESDTVENLPEQIFLDYTTHVSEQFKMFTTPKVNGKKLMSYIGEFEKTQFALERIQTYDIDKNVNNPFFRDIDFNIEKEYSVGRWLADMSGTFWLRARQLSIGFNGNASLAKWFDKTRLEQLKDFLANNEENYVLFYNYTPELCELYDICTELGYNVDVYCGEIKSLIYYDRYEQQTDAERLTNHKNIIIANFASGSTGKNWQLYNHCIVFSLPVYKDWAQGIKRIHRVGQTKTVFYHVFTQDNWLDKNMYKALKEQVDYNSEMFDSDLARVNDEIIES